MAQFQARPAKGLQKVDPVWARMRSEAEDIARREPELATFIYENVLHHDTLEAAVVHRVSERLGNADVSGDLVRQDEEGFVWVVDRKKDMIISGGENVYCAEVENVLYAHPKVLDVALYGRADERWGEIPVAVVVVAPGEELVLDELQGWLGDKLARYKHPKALVPVEAIARNAGGKVNKVALRAADRELVADRETASA